jgi:hypothetical protein
MLKKVQNHSNNINTYLNKNMCKKIIPMQTIQENTRNINMENANYSSILELTMLNKHKQHQQTVNENKIANQYLSTSMNKHRK